MFEILFLRNLPIVIPQIVAIDQGTLAVSEDEGTWLENGIVRRISVTYAGRFNRCHGDVSGSIDLPTVGENARPWLLVQQYLPPLPLRHAPRPVHV